MISLFTQPMNDIDQGRVAIKYFHNRSARYATYKESMDSLILKVGGKRPEFFLEGIGLTINSIGMSESKVKQAMESLANAGQGRIPANPSLFNKALSDRATNLTTGDWIGGLPEIAGQTAVDLAKGAQAVGDAVLDVGKSLLSVGPLLIVVAVIFIGYKRVRMVAGK